MHIKLSIRTLKRFFRIVRRTRGRLPGAVFGLFSLLAVLGVFTFFFASLEMLRWYIEREIQNALIVTLRAAPVPTESVVQAIEALERGSEESFSRRIFRLMSEPFRSQEEPEPAPRTAPPPAGPLTQSSFSDTFSGVGWLDESRTTLSHDQTVTALTFPPRFAVQSIASPSAEFRERRADGSDILCIWNDCLVERDGALFFVPFSERHAYADARYLLPLPASVASARIASLSLGRLETVWLVGAVIERSGEYEGRVFTFDGSTALTAGGVRYDEVLDAVKAPLRSRYPGVLGFGGADRDWLVVYGGYEGIAYRVRRGEPEDLSHFFGIRVMENGFQPVVLRVPGRRGAAWYVWSATEGKPKLIKLFEDGAGAIAGALDLTREVFPIGTHAAALAADSGGRLILKLGVERGTEWREFRDLGFVKTAPLELISKNLNTYANAEVRWATIMEFDGSHAGGAVDLFLSNDGATWLPAKVGERHDFSDPSGVVLLWRARVAPTGADELSPFLDRINLQFGVKLK